MLSWKFDGQFQPDAAKIEVSESLIDRIYSVFSDGIHFAKPIPALRTKEADLVCEISFFLYDSSDYRFNFSGSLSFTRMLSWLNPFDYCFNPFPYLILLCKGGSCVANAARVF